MTAYVFRPMSSADLPTIKRWLGTPYICQWRHNPLQQFELVNGDLGHPDMAQFIVTADAREFAYLQCYNQGTWSTGFGPQPEGTRGLDQFIGEADMLDHGHGSTFIGLFADRLLACGTPRIVTDPVPPGDQGLREGGLSSRSHD